MVAMVRNPDTAEDLVSRSYTAALKNLRSFRGDSSFYTWLSAIARNEARSLYRHNPGLHVTLDMAEAKGLSAPERVGETLERAEVRERVQAALQTIPPHYRQALTDRFITGYSTRQTARRRRVPLGTVLSRVANGKRILRERLED
jgi:RNA polymerase sigma-70 factor (ECF subfamily)